MVHIPVSSTPSTPPEKVRNFTGASLLGFSLALLICGAVILGNARQRLITRIGTPGQNDSALLLNFDTGSLEYRVCDNINGTGSVPYTCEPCSKSGRSSGRRGYRSFARDAEVLSATDPDASCRRDGYCSASLFFSECSDRSDRLARCFGLDDVVKPYARLTLGSCITAILSFGVPLLASRGGRRPW
jgi:hypothetical protein